jgi:hypothetical protein
MKDLVVLAADKNIEDTLKGLLTRHQSLDIRPINAQIYTEPGHDPACAQRGVNILSNFSKQYKYALLIFDYEGSGKEDIQPGSLQNKLNEEFSRSPWVINEPGLLFSRQNLRHGYGATRPMLTT